MKITMEVVGEEESSETEDEKKRGRKGKKGVSVEMSIQG